MPESKNQKNSAVHQPLTSGATARVAHAMRRVWQGIREWCGDSAYERYLYAQHLMPGEHAELTREEFYVEQLNRRYSRPNRCC